MQTKPYYELTAKIVGGIFAAIIAPIIVGVGVDLIGKKIDPSDGPQKQAAAPAPKGEAPADASKDASPNVAKNSDAPPAKEPATKAMRKRVALKKAQGTTIALFNGKNLTGFHVRFPKRQGDRELHEIDSDPDRVFSVGKNGLLHVSGQHIGVLETVEEFENYHLSLEYRWGEKRWPPRDNRERLSAVVVHSSWVEGSPPVFRPGFNCQIQDEQGAGDLLLPASQTMKLSAAIEAKTRMVVQTKGANKRQHPRYDYFPGAPLVTLTSGMMAHHRGAPEVISPGLGDTPKPGDPKWHTLEIICPGDEIEILRDGKTVLKASKLSQSRGNIRIVSEGAEIFFRNIQLQQLP